jgi:transcriptional regulator with XRE-family HTH domain
MPTIGERLRELREARGLSQPQVVERIESELRKRSKGYSKGSQRWLSDREVGTAKTSVEDAELVCRALGYSGGFVILEGDQGELVRTFTEAHPNDAALSLSFLRALPHMTPRERAMFANMVQQVLDERTKD